jgi:hypothetical protein
MQRTTDRRWAPTSFISFIDIFNAGWTEREYEAFFDENFVNDRYDIIECRFDQIDLVLRINTRPEVLIIHVGGAVKGLNLVRCSASISFIIIKSADTSTINVNVSDNPRLMIRHPGFPVRLQIVGDGVDPGVIDCRMYDETYAFDRDILRPYGRGIANHPNALIAQLEVTGSRVGNEYYTISKSNVLQGKGPFSSIVASVDGTGRECFKVNSVMFNGVDRDSGENIRLIVHGRPTVFDITVEQSFIEIFFPDMSRADIDRVSKNTPKFFGNDEKTYGLNSINNYKKQYFEDKMTFAEIVLKQHNRNVEGISQIDSYLHTLVFKSPSSGPKSSFNTMLSKLNTELEGLSSIDRTMFLRDRPFTRSKLSLISERIRNESVLSLHRRNFLLNRIRDLMTAPTPALPYNGELPVGDPILEEEQKQRRLIDEKSDRGNILLERTRKRYSIPHDTDDYVNINDEDVVIIESRGAFKCAVHNCNVVIVKGTGTVRVSGIVHTLIAEDGITIELDNTSPITVDPEIYLYVQGSSIFDIVIGYKDNLAPYEVSMLLESGSISISALPDYSIQPPWQRSVIKNLYCRTKPRNHLTAEILNFIPFA